MQVTDDYVQALRLFLTGDDGYNEISRRLEERDGDDGGNLYGALVSAAFAIAARRRFGAATQATEVIQFVAHLRAALQKSGGDIDPRTAETMLHAVLHDEPVPSGLDEQAKVLAVTALLLDMVNQSKLPDPELDTLLAQARVLGDRILVDRS
jgi:hypothetical protein